MLTTLPALDFRPACTGRCKVQYLRLTKCWTFAGVPDRLWGGLVGLHFRAAAATVRGDAKTVARELTDRRRRRPTILSTRRRRRRRQRRRRVGAGRARQWRAETGWCGWQARAARSGIKADRRSIRCPRGRRGGKAVAPSLLSPATSVTSSYADVRSFVDRRSRLGADPETCWFSTCDPKRHHLVPWMPNKFTPATVYL